MCAFKSKVSDKQWIVHECCNRVSETLIGAKQLIAYGLEITDFSAYLNIEPENTSMFYILNVENNLITEIYKL